jgi:hypothetical protein
VFVPGRGSSIIQVTRFQIQRFTVSIKELAEWFGLEITRIVVDECLPKRESYCRWSHQLIKLDEPWKFVAS